MAAMQQRTWWWLATVLAAAYCSQLASVQGFTDPKELQLLIQWRDEMKVKSKAWAESTQLWTCPTSTRNSDPGQPCDPCGLDTEGNWYHLHCRGNSVGWGESGDGAMTGLLTNIHQTMVNVNGPPPREACVFKHIREFDFKGGNLVGPVPEWLDCFQMLEELDMSNNRLAGTMPPSFAQLPILSEIKYNNNYGIFGTIPPEYGAMPRLRRLLIEYNQMTGTIPQTFRNLTVMTEFKIAQNDFEGDLSAVGGQALMVVSTHNNPKLCGMVPRSVRFAASYNPAGTNLGQPCPAS